MSSASYSNTEAAGSSRNRLAVLAAEIRAAHEEVRQSAEYTARRAYDAGERLMEARDSPDIPFRGYERWVKEVVGIPHETAKRYVQLFNAVSTGRVSIPDIAEAGQIGVLRMLRTQEARERRERSRAAEALPDGMDLRIGDCREVLAGIPPNSVQLILTDPPYGDAAEPLYLWLAKFAAQVLIPGGSLICYTGQSRLDRDIVIFREHLRFWWSAVMLHDQSQRIPGKFVIANHKPVLWFVKEFRRGRSLVPDVLRPVRDKSEHPWAQGDGGVEQWIEHETYQGETVVDPFAGTAEWGRIAVEMGRRWIGADLALGGTTTVAADQHQGGTS
jgi:hypothetical protein